MEKCKLLRFFILCNCIILSVQIFGMKHIGDTFNMSVTGSSPGSLNVMGRNVDVPKDLNGNVFGKNVNVRGNEGSDSEDVETKSTKGDFSLFKIAWEAKGFTEEDEPIYEGKVDSFKKLTVVGAIVGNQHVLTLNIENLLKDNGKSYLRVVGCQNFSLVKSFLNIKKKKNDELGISTPFIYHKKLEDFKNLCKRLNMSTELFITLCVPRILNLTMECKGIKLVGSLFNTNPWFELEGCIVSLSGRSNNGVMCLLTESIFNEKGDPNKYMVTGGDIRVSLDKKSHFSCDPGQDVVVYGTAKCNSTTYFYGKKIFDSIKYSGGSRALKNID